MKAISKTQYSALPLFRRGKVRDVYDLGEQLLIVATDRLSAFDVVLPDPIPAKGEVLTTISRFWFDRTGHIVRNHCISTDPADYPEICQRYTRELAGRSMLVKKTRPLQIECVVRGYLTGSGLKEYRTSGSVCSIPLPEGLEDGSKLPQPLFTPSTKAEEGHDENISFEQAAEIVGREVAEKVRDFSIALYSYAQDYARERGIIIADTKFEFGLDGDEIILIDEALTPDSSRFWPIDEYEPGRAQPSFDKQYIRDYLESVKWDKSPPAPVLPGDVIEGTTRKYLEAYKLITGNELILSGISTDDSSDEKKKLPFNDLKHPPTRPEIDLLLGVLPAIELKAFEHQLDLMEENLNWAMHWYDNELGWGYRGSYKSRVACVLYFYEGYFTVTLSIPIAREKEFFSLKELTSAFRQQVDRFTESPKVKWFSFLIRKRRDVTAITAIMRLKIGDIREKLSR